jgi:hypothetical protein
MTTTAYAWAPITKVEDEADGSILVYGAATDTALDRDQQRMDQGWLDKAMPQWMAEGGNVREQHDPRRAVGVAVGLHKDEGTGAWMLTSRVVDPVAVTKVKAGVLKGYSIGVKDPHITFGKAEAPNGLIDGGVVCETSLADRPSNPGSYFTLAKADTAGVLTAVEDPEMVEDEEPEDDTAALAQAALDEVRVLVPELTAVGKADAATDVATAQEAITCIGRLIQSEAEQLAAGDMDEAGDIACLLDAVRALKYFIGRESAEPTGVATMADSMSVSGDTYMADATKTETPTTETPVDAAPETPELAKVDSPDVAAIVKAAVAEAMTTLKDELVLVKADLAKVAAMPVAGGPVAMRTASQTQAARDADRATLHTQAVAYLAKADASREDPALAAGYREKAAELRAKADA